MPSSHSQVHLPSDPSFSIYRDLISLKCSASFVELDLTLHRLLITKRRYTDERSLLAMFCI